MSQTIHMICGVPGSGKTWVATQLNQFDYIAHDNHPVATYHSALIRAANTSTRPILAEAPFRISVLIDQIRAAGIKVVTYYITDDESKIKLQYEQRDHKPFPKQHTTNLHKYNQRAWDYKGYPAQILEILKQVKA